MTDFPRFEGELRQDDEALAAASVDFGKVVTRRPSAVLRVASVEDVATAVRFANERGLRVVARGQGHTTGGQSLKEGSLVLDLGALRRIDAPVPRGDGGRVTCGAGAIWVDVLRKTTDHGFTPPVLTDYLGLSVGGTLSVGGIGGQSFRYGLQVDQVARLRVVTGDGEVREASRDENPELFDGIRAGLGRLGVIVEAELALVRAPTHVHVRHLPYRTLDAFLADQERLVEDGRFGYVLGNVPARGEGWGYAIEVVDYGYGAPPVHAPIDDLACDVAGIEHVDFSYVAYVTRLEAMVKVMRESGTWGHAHPWLDVFLPATKAAAVIGEVLAALRPADVGDGYVMTYPTRRASSHAPLVGIPSEPRSFLFDVLATAAPADAAACVERVERFGRLAMEHGGTVYPIGSMRMTPGIWQTQLGERAATQRALIERYDPRGVLGDAALTL